MDTWQWTLTKEAIAPCFVRDVLDMRDSGKSCFYAQSRLTFSPDADFFWLGYTPCRTVLLVGMVVAIQVYDKRAIYTGQPNLHPSPLITHHMSSRRWHSRSRLRAPLSSPPTAFPVSIYRRSEHKVYPIAKETASRQGQGTRVDRTTTPGHRTRLPRPRRRESRTALPV